MLLSTVEFGFLAQNNFGSKNVVRKKFSLEKIWFEKYFGLEFFFVDQYNFFVGRKFFRLKKILVYIFWTQKNLGHKFFMIYKNLGQNFFFDPKKIELDIF